MRAMSGADTGPVPLAIPGVDHSLRLYLHGVRDAVISPRIRAEGIWEPFETALLLTLLRPGDVFVDAGANIGYFTVLAAARVGAAGQVFAFEPDPDNCRLLRDSVRCNGLDTTVTVVEAGLAAEDRSGMLYLSGDNLGDHQTYATAECRVARPIRLVHGANWLARHTARVDVLKVDTQGAEYEVIRGLMPLLRTQATPPHIILELTPYSLAEAGASGRALIELLAQFDQPMAIIDHIEHRLAPCSAEALAQWCDNVAATPGDRGFMNILVGSLPAM